MKFKLIQVFFQSTASMRRNKMCSPYFMFHLAHIFLYLVRFMTQVFSVFAPKNQKCHSNDSEKYCRSPPHTTFGISPV